MGLARVAAIGLGAALAIGAIQAAAGENTTVRGEARTLDGVVVPGQTEVLVIKGMPRRLAFQIPIGLVFSSPRCQGDYVCEPSFGRQRDGDTTYKTSDRGRATVTFVMPSAFFRRKLGTEQRELLRFRDGDVVRIQANGFKGKITGIAVAKARVDF